MKKIKIESKDLFILALIFIAAAWRIMMWHETTRVDAIASFTPIGAMALFGGAYFARGKALIFPILILWISDVLLNKLVFFGEWMLLYEGWIWTYGAFAIMALVASYTMKNKNIATFLGSSVLIVFIHWIVTDIGVWLYSGTYPLTLAGFWACLVAAIPFELKMLAGTLGFGSVMFGSFEYMKAKIPSLKLSSEIN